VAATLLPGSSVSRVARRYDVNANQVFAWRRRYRDGAAEPAELRLLPVTVTPDHPEGRVHAWAWSRLLIEDNAGRFSFEATGGKRHDRKFDGVL
jgi:hypothetical protein